MLVVGMQGCLEGRTPVPLHFFRKSVSEKAVQKDAPEPVSPLRVRIGRVWALGAWFGAVFGLF